MSISVSQNVIRDRDVEALGRLSCLTCYFQGDLIKFSQLWAEFYVVVQNQYQVRLMPKLV